MGEASLFCKGAELYKVFLESFHKLLDLVPPKLDKAYLVNPIDCKIVGSISATDMKISYF